jgi:hypothetical protein
MENFGLVYPMFAMVVLTCVVLAALFRARTQSVATGQVSASYFKTYRGGDEPDASVQLSRHFANIFEAPTLFYVVCLAAMIVNQTAWPLHLLAWMYVLLRAAHAHIHIGRNKLRPRIFVYFTSWIALLLMWVYVTAAVITSN